MLVLPLEPFVNASKIATPACCSCRLVDGVLLLRLARLIAAPKREGALVDPRDVFRANDVNEVPGTLKTH